MTLEERVELLEDFIGNIQEVKLYGNSLQEILDRYVSPLYIESGANNIMSINDYLGDLNKIPRNIVFKIRTSHDLDMTGQTEAYLEFSRPGETPVSFPLRKYIDGLLQPLESGNYSSGIMYDVYINSQDIAIITSNDPAALAMSEIKGLKIRATALEEKTSGISKEEDGSYTINKLGVQLLEANNTLIIKGLTFSTTALAITLPNGSLTSYSPSNDNNIVNRKYVLDTIDSKILNYRNTYHLTGTQDAAAALSGKPNGTFYYKLEN